jgi:hypothetical protein
MPACAAAVDPIEAKPIESAFDGAHGDVVPGSGDAPRSSGDSGGEPGGVQVVPGTTTAPRNIPHVEQLYLPSSFSA